MKMKTIQKKTAYNDKVKLNTIFPIELFNKLKAIRKDKGLSSEQELIRFIVTDFVKKNAS